jgi:hypothetical protein
MHEAALLLLSGYVIVTAAHIQSGAYCFTVAQYLIVHASVGKAPGYACTVVSLLAAL